MFYTIGLVISYVALMPIANALAGKVHFLHNFENKSEYTPQEKNKKRWLRYLRTLVWPNRSLLIKRDNYPYWECPPRHADDDDMLSMLIGKIDRNNYKRFMTIWYPIIVGDLVLQYVFLVIHVTFISFTKAIDHFHQFGGYIHKKMNS